MHAAWREFYGFLGIGGPKVENREFANLVRKDNKHGCHDGRFHGA